MNKCGVVWTLSPNDHLNTTKQQEGEMGPNTSASSHVPKLYRLEFNSKVKKLCFSFDISLPYRYWVPLKMCRESAGKIAIQIAKKFKRILFLSETRIIWKQTPGRLYMSSCVLTPSTRSYKYLSDEIIFYPWNRQLYDPSWGRFGEDFHVFVCFFAFAREY